MDLSWMSLSRGSSTYRKGVDDLIEYLFCKDAKDGEILCPCVRCVSQTWVDRSDARTHLICNGIVKGYTIEPAFTIPCDIPMSNGEDNMSGLVESALHGCVDDNQGNEVPNANAQKFYKLLADSKRELYPGCKKFTILSFTVRLFHAKCVGKCNEKGFGMILDILREAFPDASIPNSVYAVRKMIRDLGLGYEKIEACPNDCMLYWKDNKDKTECDICHTSRYKQIEYDSEDESTNGDDKGTKIGAKVLRYFPLIPRLQRLFMASTTAEHMRWHYEGRTNDGLMRHPADSPAWRTFDVDNPDFALEPRNVRLGLASDGFNPFGSMNLSHSTWPVVLMPYNLPPWLCMKKPYFFMTLLIPGPSAPGNNIDVYMEPLVDELKVLWDTDGVDTYDASTKTNFKLRAALMWTISDFPAYANLSGWSTKGFLACPSCHKHTKSEWLTHGKKCCYMGHRRYLPLEHPYRKNKKNFDGKEEHDRPPRALSGAEILKDLAGYKIKFGKNVKNPPLPGNWKKRSIFFDLPYWQKNLIRHNIDVMHTEKNVCDNVVGTLMDIEGKSRDHLKARRDLEEMCVRRELHPQEQPNGKVYLPPACFTMSKEEKVLFCRVLKGVKVPDGYASNISRCIQVKPPKLYGMKSHDSHILMQQLLPLAIRNVLPKHVRSVLMKLCRYYKQVCSKVLNPTDLVIMEKEIGQILCDLERIFPPSFFDVMVHLSVHLATEAKLGGPVNYRWMYPIERYLATLKGYVRNRSKPEGSISEGYLAEECMSFCSLYLSSDVETVHNKTSRNQDDGGDEDVLPIFSSPGRPIGAGTTITLDLGTLATAHSYVLFNCSEIDFLRTQHMKIVGQENPRKRKHHIQRLHSQNFESWLQDHVEELHDTNITEDIRILASGPSEYVSTYNGFLINGFRFHTKDVEKRRKTQNSGVMIEAITNTFSSARDENPVEGDVTYYGVLKEIIELNYGDDRVVVLFKCAWIPNGSSIKVDENGFTTLNFNTIKDSKEPFILASQAKQVFYVADRVTKGCKAVIKTTARNTFEMDEQPSDDDVETHLQSDTPAGPQVDENTDIELVRGDLDGTYVDNNTEPVEEAS